MDVQVEWNENRKRAHVGCGGLIVLVQGKTTCSKCAAVDNNGGWLRKVLMWNWSWLALDGYPGWDLVATGHERHPPFVRLSIVHGKGKSSSDIANEWDNVSEGLFYYRDWTEGGTPFVRDGETYRAGFWFERASDHDAFVKKYGHMLDANPE